MQTKQAKLIIAGIAFAVLWVSASTATKIGLMHLQPLVIAEMRFFIAAIIMLFVAHVVLKKRLPAATEWKQLAIYGLLNISIYLGLYVVAMQHVSAGLGSLFVGTNPVFISLIGSIWLKQPLKRNTVISLLLCIAGIVIAAYPLLQKSYATPAGLFLLLISMACYSVGALYFSRSKWHELHILTINGWQTFLGGIFLLPVAFVFYQKNSNQLTTQSLGAVLWLAIPVSIIAVQLWLYLLKDNPVKASFWLFLCPVFGIAIAALFVNEPVSFYTLVGVILIIAGLYMVQKK